MKLTCFAGTLLFILSLCHGVNGQSDLATGLIMEEESGQDALAGTVVDLSAAVALPEVIDLSPFAPEPGNQGEIQSCVGWACGYGAFTMMKAIQENWTSKNEITRNAYSPHFIYNQIKRGNCMSGAKITDALRFLKRRGICLASEFEESQDQCDKLPDLQLRQKAGFQRIETYQRLAGFDTPAEHKVQYVKRAIAAQKPVVVGLNINRNFFILKDAEYWWPDLGNTTPAGGHALTVVGYNDAKQAFQLLNSWGKEWGNEGFIWIKYDAFAAHCKYAYTFSLLDEPPTVRLSGGVELSYRLRSKGMVRARVQHSQEEKTYTLEKRDFITDRDLFQLQIELPEGCYVYQLNMSPDRKVRLNWSFSEWHVDTTIILPPQGFVQYSKAGAQTLCFLFSAQPITQIDNLTRLLKYEGGKNQDRIKSVFEELLIREDAITYAADEIAFQSSSPYGAGFVVPVFVTIQLQD